MTIFRYSSMQHTHPHHGFRGRFVRTACPSRTTAQGRLSLFPALAIFCLLPYRPDRLSSVATGRKDHVRTEVSIRGSPLVSLIDILKGVLRIASANQVICHALAADPFYFMSHTQTSESVTLLDMKQNPISLWCSISTSCFAIHKSVLSFRRTLCRLMGG